jgi:hypothetical protein
MGFLGRKEERLGARTNNETRGSDGYCATGWSAPEVQYMGLSAARRDEGAPLRSR